MKQRKSILKLVEKDKLLIRLIFFFISVFVVAFNYNAILVKNNLVIGGVSGLAIVIKELTNLSPTIFLYLSTVVLVVFSMIFLDKNMTFRTLFGSLTFNIMVTITNPIVDKISINFESYFMLLIYISVVNGICYGLIYRAGYNTGGSDTITAIISKYTKLPMGASATWTNIFIILFGWMVFGLTKTIYSVFILLLSNKITDIVLLGVKDSKMCYVKSNKSNEIQSYLLQEVNIGVTELVGKGGLFKKEVPVLLVIVPFDKYYGFKHLIKKIDSEGFMLTTSCHDVSGGYKKKLLPF